LLERFIEEKRLKEERARASNDYIPERESKTFK
jgi:hypothetical protein